MIAIDTQILVYAHRGDHAWHARAHDRIAGLAAGGAQWAIPMHCLVEFYATVTHARYARPSTPQQAAAQTDAWLASPTLVILTEDAKTWSATRDLLVAARISGSRTYDARIAAVCLQHGVTELWSNDRDYSQFPALRVRNPLIDIEPTRAGEPRATYAARARGAKAVAVPARPKTKRR
jgi:toxin-antitoxin system PIN domain toxin